MGYGHGVKVAQKRFVSVTNNTPQCVFAMAVKPSPGRIYGVGAECVRVIIRLLRPHQRWHRKVTVQVHVAKRITIFKWFEQKTPNTFLNLKALKKPKLRKNNG